MTKARKYFGALALISGATLSLVACGNNKHTNSSNANKTNHKFSETVPVKSIKTLTYAVENKDSRPGLCTSLSIVVSDNSGKKIPVNGLSDSTA